MANRTYTVGGRTYTVSDKERQDAIQEIATKGYRDYSKVVNEVNSLTDNQRAALEAALINNESVRRRDARNRPEDTAIAKYIEAIKEITREDGTVPYGPKSYRFNVYADGVPDANARKAYDSLSYKDQLLLDIDKKGKPVTPDFGDPNVDTSVYDRYQQALAKIEQDAVDKADADAVKAIEDAYRNNRGNYEYDPKEAARTIKESNKKVTYTQSELVDIYEGLQEKYDWDDEAFAAWGAPPEKPAARSPHINAVLVGKNGVVEPTAEAKSESSPAAGVGAAIVGGAANIINNAAEKANEPARTTSPHDPSQNTMLAGDRADAAIAEEAKIAKATSDMEDYLRVRNGTAFMKAFNKLTGRDSLDYYLKKNERGNDGQFGKDVAYITNQAMQGIGDFVGGVATLAGLVIKAEVDHVTTPTRLVENDGERWTMEEARARFAPLDTIMYIADTTGNGSHNVYNQAGAEEASGAAQFIGGLARAYMSSVTSGAAGAMLAYAAPALTTTFDLSAKLGAKAPAAVKTLAKLVPTLKVGVNQVPFLAQSFGRGFNQAKAEGYNDAGALIWGSWMAIAEGIPESISWNWSSATGSTIKSKVLGGVNKDAAKAATKKGLKNLMGKLGDSNAMKILAAMNAEGMEEVMTNYLEWFGRETILKQDADLPTLRENLTAYASGALLSGITQGFAYAATTPARKQAEAIVEGMVNGQPPTAEQVQALDDANNEEAAKQPLTNEQLEANEGEGLNVDEKIVAEYRAVNDELSAAEKSATDALATLQQMNANGVAFGDPARVEAVKAFTAARQEVSSLTHKRDAAHAKYLGALDGLVKETEAAVAEADAAQQQSQNEYAQWQYQDKLENDPQGLATVINELQAAVNDELSSIKDALKQNGSRMDIGTRDSLMQRINSLNESAAKLQQMASEVQSVVAIDVDADSLPVGLTRSYTRDSLTNESRSAVRHNRNQLHAVDVIAKKYGRKVVLVDTLKGKSINGEVITEGVNGLFDPSSGVIYIAADAQEGAFSYFAIHELVHSVKNSDPEGYEALCDTILEELMLNGEDIDALIDYQQNVVYKGAIDLETAIEEVVANTAPAILTDENYVRSMYEGNRSLFDKIRDFFNELKQAFANLTQYRSLEQGASLGVDSVAKIAEVFDRVAATPDGGGGGGARFSMKEPVERVGNLVAVHSLNHDNAMKAIQRGGIPAPSLAITNSAAGIPEYGDISFFADSSSVNPEADERNKMYAGDAHSPRYPEVSMGISGDAQQRIGNMIEKHADKLSDEYVQDARKIQNSNESSDKWMLSDIKDNAGLMAVYLADRKVKVPRVEAGKRAWEYSDKLRSMIRWRGGEKKYLQWAMDLLGKDWNTGEYVYMDTDEGRTRMPATLENVAQVMSSPNGGELRNALGTKGLRGLHASLVRQMGDLDQVRARERMITGITPESRAKYRDAQAKLDQVVSSLKVAADPNYKYKSIRPSATELIDRIVKEQAYSEQAMSALLSNEGYIPDKDLVRNIADMLSSVRNLPVDYFEAKLARVLGIDEVKLALLPEGKYPDLVDALNNAGIDVAFYNGTKADRTAVMNARAAQLMFSAKDTAKREHDIRTAERIAEGRKQSAAQHRAEGRYEAANARAKERIDALKQRVLDERAAGEINTAIAKKEASQRIAELKQQVLDERAAGEINTAIARKEGRERTAEALAEQKEHYAEQEAKKAQKEIRDKAVKTADELIDWIMSPTRSKRHVPKDTLYDIANTLGAITLGDESKDSTEAKNWRAKVEGMKAAVAMVNEPIYSGPYDQAIEVGENIGDDLAALRKALNPGNPNSEAAAKRRERDAKAKQAGQMVAEFIPDVNGSINIDQMDIEEIGELERTLGIIKNAVIRTSEKTERANAKKYAERITGNAKELTTWLSRPTDKHHVPEYLRNSVANFVETIDLDDASSTTKKATDWRLRLHQLKDAMQRADAASGGALAISNDPALNAFMTDLLEKVPSEVRNIKQMDAQQLEELDRVMTIVKRTVAFANKTFKSDKFEHISAVGDVSIAEMNSAKGKSNFWKTFPGADRFFNSQQLDSFSFFHGLGGAAQSILQEMRDGFDAKVHHIDQAIKFVRPLVKGVNIRKISGDTAKAYDLKLESGSHIRMTTAQMMELYELLKRDQARLHIFGGGIRIADIGRAGLTRDIKQVEPVTITARDAVRIVSNLTDSQKELADKLAWFMGNECAAWGNDTSMLMYGYRKFTEENYYPIHSDPNSTLTNDKNDKNQNGAFAMLENLGMTKATQAGANNAIVIGDIFDTFVQHVDDMASYNGLTPAISDAMKWYNYQAGDNQSVKRSLERVAGDSAKSYFETFIKQLNGVSGRGERIGWASKLTSNAKSAAIGCNLRVWVQQPGAYFRAGAILKDKYMRAGLSGVPMAREAKKYCPIAKWKSWGFYDVAIGKSMRGLLLNDDGLAENIRSVSMAPAGIADSITFGALFRACCAEQRDLHPKWTREQQMAAAGKRLSEVIDRTQVVDTPFHRSALMRSNDGLVKLQTAFMAEPTKNYNLMRTALADMADKSDKEAPKRFVKTAMATMMSMVATSALAAIADVGRDDDEGETVTKKYWEALKENLKDNTNPLNQIPFVKDVMSMVEGYNASRLDMQGVEKLLDAFDMWKRHLEKGADSRYTHWDLAYKTAQALSTVSGIPVGNLMREVKAIENMVGISLRTKTDLKAAAERYEELFGSIIDAAGDHAQLLADALDKVER